jgi:hypothetical protein
MRNTVPDVTIKNKEGTWIKFTITDPETGEAVSVVGATLTFVIRPKVGSNVVTLSVPNGSFDISQAANGIVRAPITTSDSDRVGYYESELKIDMGVTDTPKSPTFVIYFAPAVTD